MNPGCPVAGHSGPVHSVNFSPDGTHMVTGSYDERVTIWHAATGAEVSSFVTVRSGWSGSGGVVGGGDRIHPENARKSG